MLHRRRFLRLATAAAALPAWSQGAAAQAYPTRPVRWMLGFTAGGTTDIISRVVAQALTEQLGQPFIIESRPGAGTNIATEQVVRAPPDGYTLLFAGAPNAINAALYPKLNFNFIRDVAPVAGIVRVPNVLVVHPSVPVATLPEFIAYAKANPGKINMASSGNGSVSHVFGELFKMMAGVDLVHVPYRGGYVSDLLGGQTQVVLGTIASCIQLIGAGKLRALAVTTATRSPALPDVPAMGESVPGYDATQWYGLGAPRNTPVAIIGKLNSEIKAGLADPKLAARLAGIGVDTISMTSADFGNFIANETEKWGKVIRAAGIKPV